MHRCHCYVGNSSVVVDAELIKAFLNLVIVRNLGCGVEKIDLDACKERGILVTNTSEVSIDEVADLTIGLILALMRRICECDRHVGCGKWKHTNCKLTTKVKANYYVHGLLISSLNWCLSC